MSDKKPIITTFLDQDLFHLNLLHGVGHFSFKSTEDYLTGISTQPLQRRLLNFPEPGLENRFIISDLLTTERQREDISDYRITAEGVVEEQWTTIENIYARILEVTKSDIVLECIIDPENKTVQNRKFERFLIENAVPLKNLHPVIIKIFRRPGEIRFRFIDGKNVVPEKLFHTESFERIDPKKFSKKL